MWTNRPYFWLGYTRQGMPFELAIFVPEIFREDIRDVVHWLGENDIFIESEINLHRALTDVEVESLKSVIGCQCCREDYWLYHSGRYMLAWLLERDTRSHSTETATRWRNCSFEFWGCHHRPEERLKYDALLHVRRIWRIYRSIVWGM